MIQPNKPNDKPDNDNESSTTGLTVGVIDIGNSAIAVGLWRDGAIRERQSFNTEQLTDIVEYLKVMGKDSSDGILTQIAVGSVVPNVLSKLEKMIGDQLNVAPLIIGREIPIPVPVKLEHPERVGIDRLCNAAAAFHANKKACTIVDCGTAITIDVVDDEGAFIGGAIFPGYDLQARALHEHTAALPLVNVEKPTDTIGTNTEDAIKTAIYRGTAGAVRGIVEAYATELQTWPTVIATGGHAEWVADDCDIFDAIVPSLCLIGIGLAYDKRTSNAVSL